MSKARKNTAEPNILNQKFGHSHAFIIGIDQYEQLSKLDNAVNDAQGLAKVLQHKVHGYTVYQPLLNATYQQIKDLLLVKLPEKVKKGERVLLYYAGHGIADDSDDDTPKGFLLPSDANRRDHKRSIPMSMLKEAIEKLDCQHFLLILDCCFAGAFRWSNINTRAGRQAPKKIYQERFDKYIEDKAWQVITSAGYNQEAIDEIYGSNLGIRLPGEKGNSIFAQFLFKALEGEADIVPTEMQDGLITASELYVYLRDKIEELSIKLGDSYRQTPSFFPLSKHTNGEYVFLSPTHKLNLPGYDPKLNPYLGLNTFGANQQELFFGRDSVIQEINQLLHEKDGIIIEGPSKTGKSSLVRAGLLPALKNSEQAEYVTIRLATTPLKQLEKAIGKATKQEVSYAVEGLNKKLITALKEKKLVLFIDHIEEICAQEIDAQQRNTIFDFLQQLLNAKLPYFKLIFSIRSDYKSAIKGYKFFQSVQINWYDMPAFEQQNMRESILYPAAQSVLQFDPPQLVDKIINQLHFAPARLPMLSLVMNELFKAYIKAGAEHRAITHKMLQKLKGVKGIIYKHADQVFAQLNTAEQLIMQQIFIRLISFQGKKIDSRKLSAQELDYSDPEKNKQVENVLSHLVEQGILVIDGDESGQTEIEIGHICLLESWPKAKEWLRSFDPANIELQRNQWRAAKNYEDKKNDKASYHRDNYTLLWENNPNIKKLEDVLNKGPNWLNRLEETFVKKSLEARQDELERMRRERDEALRSAKASELTALALSVKGSNPTEAIRLAEEGQKIKPDYKMVQQAISDIINEARTFPFYQSTFSSRHYTPGVVAFCPKTSLFASGDEAGQIQILDAQGKILKAFKSSKKAVSALCFSPNGEQLLAGYKKGGISFFNLEGKKLDKITTGTTTPSAIIFSGDGELILYSAGQSAYLHDSGGKRLKRIKANKAIKAIAFSTKHNFFAAGLNDGTLVLYHCPSGQKKASFQAHEEDITGISFSDDEEQIFTLSIDRTVKQWTIDLEPIHTFANNAGELFSLATSPCGTQIIYGGEQGLAKLIDLQRGTTQILKSHRSSVTAVGFSATGSFAYTASELGTIKIWDLKTRIVDYSIRKLPDRTYSVSFSSDKKYLLTSGKQRITRKWDLEGHLLDSWPIDKTAVQIFHFSPAKEQYLVAYYGKTIQVFDYNNEVLHEFKEDEHRISAAIYNHDGSQIITGNEKGQIKFWSLEGELMQSIQAHDREINFLAQSAQGQFLCSGAGTLKVWKDQKLHHQIDTLSFKAAFSPDEQWLLIGAERKALYLNLKLLTYKELIDHRGKVEAVAFSDDSAYMLTGGSDKTVRLWDKNARKTQSYTGHQNSISEVTFSKDGKYILSASDNETMRFMAFQGEVLASDTIAKLGDEKKKEFGILEQDEFLNQ
jgi:WD40 repeat protein